MVLGNDSTGCLTAKLRIGVAAMWLWASVASVRADGQASRPLDLAGARARPQVAAELLADVEAVQPGKAFTVGVLFRMLPGWHIYWKNPGDSGLPTSVRFGVAKGFQVGPLRWPVPARFDQPGRITGYGYRDAVLLLAEITPPKELPAGSAAVSAEVAWLACKESCVLGRAKLHLSLPVAEKAGRANQKLFAQWRDRLPLEVGRAAEVAAVTVSGHIPEGKSRGAFTILARWKVPPADVAWLAAPEPALAIEDVSVRTQGGQTRIAFTARVLAGQELKADTLETLIVFSRAGAAAPAAPRRAVLVPVRLAPTPATKPSQ